ncbi:Uncharacterised protein [Mycobacteroides abscessus subsp. abscessus]|nr:Uncharacterised protein [Mycobacteroides abscessus subsp. abscessus]
MQQHVYGTGYPNLRQHPHGLLLDCGAGDAARQL